MSPIAIVLGSALGIMLFLQCNCDTLKMIAVLSRHGDRSPSGSYKKDPHANHEWFGGIGALSLEGYVQIYKLGQNLHTRYRSLLPDNLLYTKEMIHVESSVTERTIMSAQLSLAGLLPINVESYLHHIHWQPVPVHVIPFQDDYKILSFKSCPKYDVEYDSVIQDPDFLASNRHLFEYVAEHSGENYTKTPWNVAALYDTFHIQQKENLPIPQWANATILEQLKAIGIRFQFLRTETPFMKKMKGGPLVTEIVTNMEKKIANTLKPNRAMFYYSGHDITITNVLNALGVKQEALGDGVPDYGAAVVFELYENREVKLVYYSDFSVESPKELSIPNCETPCLITKFRKVIRHIEMNYEDYDELCSIPK